MNVLFVTSDIDVLKEGTAAQADLLERAKASDRLMVIVLNSYFQYSAARKISERIWLFPTNSYLPIFKLFSALSLVRREIFFRNHLQADLIAGADPFFAGIVATITSTRYKKPLQVHIAGDPLSISGQTFNLFRYLFARMIIPYADAVTVESDGTLATLQRIDISYRERAIHIPRFIDVNTVDSAEGEDLHLKYTQFRAVFLMVGPIVRQSNMQVAVQAIAESSKYYSNIGLVIVGAGSRKGRLLQYARNLGIADRVIFERPRKDLISYYRTCYALIMPAFSESYGNTLEEAAAAGCAIVSSPVGIAPRIIRNGENGFLCNPKEPHEWQKAVDALVYSPALRTQMKNGIVESMRAYMDSIKVDKSMRYRESFKNALKSEREAATA